jgi:hypothetical protein
MESLYMFPRRLFWGRWQSKLSKLSQHLFFDLVWELSNAPHIFKLDSTIKEMTNMWLIVTLWKFNLLHFNCLLLGTILLSLSVT